MATGLSYLSPCPDSEECLSFAAPPVTDTHPDYLTPEDNNINRYCSPCREAGCPKEGKHVERQNSL